MAKEGRDVMLKLAVAAQLPLIEISTRDTINIAEVIQHITGKKPKPWDKGPVKVEGGGLYWVTWKKDGLPILDETLYQRLVLAEASLLVVNSGKPSPLCFAAGELVTPRSLMLKFLKAVVTDEEKAKGLLPALGGCTIKEAVELARMAMARDHGLTPAGLMRTRKEAFTGSRGLTQVNTEQLFYLPPGFLQAWLAQEKHYFLNGEDRRLRPRGLLMDGMPGTGKTEAAKWLANGLGVPLFRIDVGAVKEKWVGASEANLQAALGQLDNEEPCVALFDEIEKVFASGHGETDSNTTTTMLSQLLWWLAEHRSRVLAVMTTNARRKLPPELYREGRIDEVMVFEGLTNPEAVELAGKIAETFGVVAKKLTKEMRQKAIAKLFGGPEVPLQRVSHAAVTKAVYSLVKQVSAK